jgi:hypothetical protein
MRRVVEDAVVKLGTVTQTGQSVEIFKNTDPAIIGIDGHSSFRDELVEVRWDGSHCGQLEQVAQVEIKDRDGNLIEALPMNATRAPFERGGVTVFFLTDAE